MKHRKHGARLLGLLAVAALGVMAFAASAQAVVPAFLVAALGATKLLTSINAVQIGVGTMLVPGLNFRLSCKKLTLDEGVIENNNDAKGVLLYTGCTTLDNTTLSEISCEVVEPIKAEALFLPAEDVFNEPAVLAENIKALIRLTKVGDLTKPCVLPEDSTVTGQVCLRIVPFTNGTANPWVETSATLQELCKGGGVKDVLKYGGQPATIDGSAEVFGIFEHAGRALGVFLI
jgi:hypothetical protein